MDDARVPRFEISPKRKKDIRAIPISKNHKIVCDALLSGATRVEAWRLIYPDTSDEGARVSCGLLLKRPHIEYYMRSGRRQIHQAVKKSVVMDNVRVMEEIACIALSNPVNLFNLDGSYKHIVDMDEPTQRAIASFKASTINGNTKITEVKLWNKTDALGLVTKVLGMIIERSAQLNQTTVIHEIRNMPVDKAQQLVDELRKKQLELQAQKN